MSRDAKLARESDFWDAKQAELMRARDPALYRVAVGDRTDRAVPWLPYIGFPAYLGAMLDHLGPLAGKRVLDLGTGTGFVAALLAAHGASVDAVDVSEASLEVARWRAEISGVGEHITFHRCPAETLPFDDACFDAVCGAFVLHHLDLTSAAPEIDRVLRRGGRGAFIETSGRSRLLTWARQLLPGRFGIEKASSDDEAPLSEPALAVLEQTFGKTIRSEVPATLFFRMACYIPPLHKPPFSALWACLDAQMQRFVILRAQSYHCVITFESSHMDNRHLRL